MNEYNWSDDFSKHYCLFIDKSGIKNRSLNLLSSNMHNASSSKLDGVYYEKCFSYQDNKNSNFQNEVNFISCSLNIGLHFR